MVRRSARSDGKRCGSSLWLALAAVAGALSAGCNGGDEVAALPAKRVALAASQASETGATGVDPYARSTPGEKPELWEITAASHNVGELALSDGRAHKILVAVDPKERVFSLRGKFDVADVNEIELGVQCGGLQQVVARFMRGAKEVAITAPKELAPSPDPTTVVLLLPTPPPDDSKCNRFELHFTGVEPRVALVSLAMGSRKPSGFGPSDGSEFEWHGFGQSSEGEGRTVQLASTQRELAGDVQLGREPRFEFSYGVPGGIRVYDEDVSLEVSIDAGAAGRIEKRFEIAEHDPERSPFYDASIDLEDLAGARARVSFRVTANAGVDAACLLSDVWVLDSAAAAQPSVLVITTDTLRADHVGAAKSGVRIDTPTLDALAARGVLFSDCWSSTNTTNPSHGAIFTGLSPRDTGIRDQQTPLAPVAMTLAEHFRAQGYATWAAISAKHLGPVTSGLGQGFDRISWPAEHVERSATETVDELEAWLARAGGRPVFVWLHVFDAHYPYAPPAEFDGRYRGSAGVAHEAQLPKSEVPEGLRSRDEFAGVSDLDFARSQYRAEVSYLDSQLARIAELPRFAQGVVAVVADHGESLGEHNVLFDHAALDRATLHVPLIVAWPGAPAGTRCDAPVTSLDLGRTLLDLAGHSALAFPGRDLREQLGAAPSDTPRFAIAANVTEASVTFGAHHLILQLADHFEAPLYTPRKKHTVELYDIVNDPACLTNLVERELATAKRLRASLIAWLAAAPRENLAGTRSENADLLSELAALGYAAARHGGGALWEDDDCAECALFR